LASHIAPVTPGERKHALLPAIKTETPMTPRHEFKPVFKDTLRVALSPAVTLETDHFMATHTASSTVQAACITAAATEAVHTTARASPTNRGLLDWADEQQIF
jgi:hypothetical protein